MIGLPALLWAGHDPNPTVLPVGYGRNILMYRDRRGDRRTGRGIHRANGAASLGLPPRRVAGRPS